MTKYVNVIITFLIIAAGPMLDNVSAAQEAKLTLTLNHYFGALRAGDINTLKSLMSHELLQRRNAALSNPRYSEFLTRMYGDAEFEVIGFMPLGANQIAVDIRVTLNGRTLLREIIVFINDSNDWKLHKDKWNPNK